MNSGLFAQIKNAVLFAAFAVLQVVSSFSADASHTRGSTIYWEKHPTLSNTIILYMTTSVAGSQADGTFSALGDGGTLSFGASVNITYSSNGSSNTSASNISSISSYTLLAKTILNNTIENYHQEEIGRIESGVWTPGIIVTYNVSSWPYSINFTNACCRVSNISAGTGTESNLATLVNLSGNNSSPVSASPAVIQVPSSAIGGTWTFQLSASDPNQDALLYRIGTNQEFGGNWSSTTSGPNGLTISSTGLITWNIPSGTSTSALAVLGYVIEDRDPLTNQLKSSSSYDIILRIVQTTTNQPPTIVSQPQTTRFFPHIQNQNTVYTYQVVVEDVYNAATNTRPNPSGSNAGYSNFPYPNVVLLSNIPNLTYSLSNSTPSTTQRVTIDVNFSPTSSQAGATYPIQFEINDGSLTTYSTVFIQVRNDPNPTIQNFTKTGQSCTSNPFSLTDFTSQSLGNYYDPDNDALSAIRIESLPAHGVLKYNGVAVTVGQDIPAASLSSLTYYGTNTGSNVTSFTYRAKDALGYVSTDSKTVNVSLTQGASTLATASNGSTFIPLRNVATLVDPNIGVTFNDGINGTSTTIDGARVSIESAQSGDQLLLNTGYSLPSGVTASFNSSTYVLEIYGQMTSAQMESLFRNISFKTTSTSTAARTIAFTIGRALPDPVSGHYYEVVTLNSGTITWEEARVRAKYLNGVFSGSVISNSTRPSDRSLLNNDQASAIQGTGALQYRTLNGLRGYLANVTTLAEHEFLKTKLSGIGWIGGSDIDNEGVWIWMDGPEAGLQFWNSSSVRRTTNTISGQSVFNYWSDSEPNNSGSQEHFSEFGFGSAGVGSSWNDCGNNCSRNTYIIEYGGSVDDVVDASCFSITARKTLTINNYPSLGTLSNQSTCSGSQHPATTVTVSDVETSGSNLQLSVVSSSNTALAPVANIVVGGAAPNFTISVSAVSGQTGSSTIVLKVVDGSGAETTGSFLYDNTSTQTPVVTYPTSLTFYSSEVISPVVPAVSNSSSTSFSISPAFGGNSGLQFNTSTGAISGTPTIGFAPTSYIITATNVQTGCTSTTTTSIQVLQCSGIVVSDFTLRGNATILGSGASTEFQLTAASNTQFGAVWNQTRLDLTRDFDISSQVYLGNQNGADGIAFVLQPLSTNQGSSGGGLGYAGINPSLAVEFDTYTNTEPTSDDHISIMLNGNTVDHTFAGHHAVEMEDGQWRVARFKWEAATKTFTVYLNGTQILQKANYDVVANIFSNNPYVYWGFTGATGGQNNLQKVKFDRYCLTLAANTLANVTTTTPIGTVTSTTAAIDGEVVNDGGAQVTERGFVVGLATAPTTTPATGGFKITDSNPGVGTYSGSFTGLQPATLYYARAYAVNSLGTAYGNEISFYTRPADITGITSSDYNTTHQANVICYGASTTLTAAGVSGTVYWYTGSCGGTQVGTGNTLTVSPTVTTTYYARNYNNNLFSDGCSSITVVVRPQLVAPVISGAEIICWNSQATGLAGTLATGGSSATVTPGFSYQWQKSEDLGTTWTDLVGETNPASLLPGYLYQTTQYRLLATDLGSPSCTTDVASNVIEVTVRDPFTPSVVSTTHTNNTVCQAGSVSLTATPTTGGSGPPFQYQWQRSYDSINWVDEGPALQNVTAYTVPSVTTDTYYRLIAFDQGTPGCGSVFSTNSVKVMVQTAITEGAISGAQHICAATAPTAPIASVTVGTGRGTISYRWEASTDNGQTWATVAGATGASYQPGVLQTTTDYRRYTVSTFRTVSCESLQPTNVIRIEVDQLPVATIATSGTTSCVNTAVTVPGVTINHGTAVWTHNGQGAITGTLAAPIYTPAAADAGTTVTLTLTVTGTAICLNVPAVDTYDIVVDPLPIATAGGTTTICENRTHTVSGAAAANGTILWTHNGAGSLSNATTLTPTYTAAAGDAGQAVVLTMTVSSNNTCTPATATATYTVNVDQLPAAAAGGTQTICSMATATVSGATSARGTILWTHNGAGTLADATTLTPTYTAGAADAGTTVTLTMTVTSTNTCGPQTATATYTVVVRPDFVPATFVGQNQDLCYNTGASQITATAATGGTGPYAYQWQVSTNGTTWSNINGATSLTYTPAGTYTSTRYYRILSTDLGTPTCGTTLAGASDMTLLVRAPLTPPVLAAVTICQGTSTTLTPSLALGGRNNFTYQWQQSANGTTGWTNVGTSSTSISFTTPNLTGSTYYRVIARDENVTTNNVTYISCGSTFSQPIHVVVANTATPGSISGDEVTCVGLPTATITSATAGTGSGTLSYRWEQSTDNGTTWTTVSGANAATYAPGNLTVTTQFRRYTVATLNGNSCESVPTSVITKTVHQLPVFTVAGSNTSVNTDAGLPTAVVNYTVTATAATPVTLTYAMTGATTASGSGTGSGSAFGIGTTTVTVTATTNCGTNTSTFTVEVIDNENPVITAGGDVAASTTTATTGCAMPLTITSPVATDNAPGVAVSYVLTGATTGSGTSIAGVSFNVGTTVITWTATDGSGNTATDVQNVVVTDAVLPAIAGTPGNITVNASAGLCTAPATWTAPTASDECGIQTFTGSAASGDLFPVGATTVTYTATDIHGNVATSTFTVTVVDNQLPVISGTPANITVTSDANACGTIVTWTAATAADNCAISTFAPNIASGSFFAVGRTRVRYTAVDVNGNSDTTGF